MQLRLHLPQVVGRAGGSAISWPSLWGGGLVALATVLALSTQFLFQLELYDDWPLRDIVRGWLDYFVDLATVGGCIFAAAVLAASLRVRAGAVMHAVFALSIALGALGGEALLLVRAPLPAGVSTAQVLFAKVARWIVFGLLARTVYLHRRRAAQVAAQAHANGLQRIQLQRQMTEARLQTLRAQIEPHFLFNTLANIQRLYQTDAGRGRSMLANFIAYLRAALPQMRRDETTLRQEAELARAYLRVLKVRMGARLSFRLDVPSELGGSSFPPFALSTLTENAIKHGLNPLPEGGSIEITARRDGKKLKVQVADTGAGLRQTSGTGAGIANLRARLAALYGDEASLDIEANAPRGIRATIAMPVRSAGEAVP